MGARPAERAAIFRSSLPGGWTVSEGPDGIAHCDYLVVCDGVADGSMLAGAERLRRVVCLAEGGATVDLQACLGRGVAVDVIPSPTSISVAEHAVTLTLMLHKRIPEATAQLRAGRVAGGVEPARTSQRSFAYNWVGLRHWETLHGQTVGLVGLGEIGRIVARRLRAFGARVLYSKPARLAAQMETELGVHYATLEDLLHASRCVSLHNVHTAETERMMGEREFAAMRPGSLFVNTARGGLVDEAALVAALERGPLAGAALDVFEYEPLAPDSPLLRAPYLLMTPHTGGIPVAESERISFRQAARLLVDDVAA